MPTSVVNKLLGAVIQADESKRSFSERIFADRCCRYLDWVIDGSHSPGGDSSIKMEYIVTLHLSTSNPNYFQFPIRILQVSV
jgi:hypothetical protein